VRSVLRGGRVKGVRSVSFEKNKRTWSGPLVSKCGSCLVREHSRAVKGPGVREHPSVLVNFHPY
jgi:hypothetical protein